MRQSVSLNGEWDFITDRQNLGEDRCWFKGLPRRERRRATVPGPYQAQFPDLSDYSGYVWYSKQLKVPKNFGGARAFLSFGSINYDPKIWINGSLAGSFEGGYRRFRMEVGDILHPGRMNTMAVRAYFPPERILGYYPHGKQKWYGHAGGIWQSVELTFAPRYCIKEMSVSTEFNPSKLNLRVVLSDPPPADKSIIEVSVFSAAGYRLGTRSVELSGNKTQVAITVPVSGVIPWSPESPRLYEARVLLRSKASGETIDELHRTVGFKKVEARNGKVCLNGKPLLIRGALTQGFYPKTLYTPPSDDFIRRELLGAKRMGLNLLRVHVKVEDERYLSWADKLGILIWEDVPSLEIFGSDGRRRLEEIFKDLIERGREHPSAMVWCLVNEAWGVDPTNPLHRRWLLKMFDLGRRLVDGGLIIDNSPCPPNFHVRTDLADFHYYRSIPQRYSEWDDLIGILASRRSNRKILFGPKNNNNKQHAGGEPIVVSEFGAWGLPSKLTFWTGSKTPWWFGQGWGSGVPSGVLERFSSAGLSRVWKDPDDFALATQRHELLSLRYLIESIRKRSEISGYVITQLYDLHWECNGLLDFDRGPKEHFNEEIARLNSDDLLFVDRARAKLNVWEGERFTVPVLLSKWSERTLQGELIWRFGGRSGEKKRRKIRVRPYKTSRLCQLELVAPHISSPSPSSTFLPHTKKCSLEVGVRRRGEGSKSISAAGVNFLVVSREKMHAGRSFKRRLVIRGETPLETRRLTLAGYRVTRDLAGKEEGDLLLTGEPNRELAKHIEAGGRALVILNRPGSVWIAGRTFSIEALDEEAMGYYYIVKRELFQPLPVENPMGWTYYKVLPRHIIRDVACKDREAGLAAGYFEGWVNHEGAILLSLDGGSAIVTTLNFKEYGRDPATTVILDNLLRELSQKKLGEGGGSLQAEKKE